MKTTLRKMLAIAACVMLIGAMLAGCGKKSELVGTTWKLTKVSYSGMEMTPKEMMGSDMTVELKDDGKALVKLGDDSENDKWEETDDGWKFTFKSGDKKETLSVKLDDDKKSGVANYDGVKFYFEKQS
ncbi:MAG: hypothetical protein ACI4LM_00410 [Anaerovoracaceae bacterium]|jgi:hypothetical protein